MSRQHTSVRSYGVLVEDQRILLVRSSNPRHDPPLWWLPGGGVKFAETPIGALSREFLEETGLVVDQPTLLDVTSDVRRRDNGDRIHAVRVIYAVHLAGGTLRHEANGTTDHASWFPLHDLASLRVADYALVALEAFRRSSAPASDA